MNRNAGIRKLYPFLMVLGAGILLFRTISLMFFEHGLRILELWVNVLTIIEMIIDAVCIVFSLKWLLRNTVAAQTISLTLGATAAIFHAFRVLIYVIGRLGPWKNFDVKPAFRASAGTDIFWVYFAGILSLLGLLAVILIWIIRKKRRRYSSHLKCS